MATSYVRLVHPWVNPSEWSGASSTADVPSKIVTSSSVYNIAPEPKYTEATFLFGPDHPGRHALDSDPESYWQTGDRTESADSGFFGTIYCQIPTYDPSAPVTLRFYVDNVAFLPTWPEDLLPPRLNVRIAPNFAEVALYLDNAGGGLWVGEIPDLYVERRTGEDYDFQVQVDAPSQFGIYLRMHLFHIEVDYTPPSSGGGMYRLRQRQTLPGTDSWPLRQRHNGSHTGSWPLRQRQTGI